MKRIIRLLYCNPDADLSGYKDKQIRQALEKLTDRLTSELNQSYRWLASCTVAVVAGTWGGERRRKRRIKLLKMINTCRVQLSLEPLVMENDHWASSGLYYGYGAASKYGHDSGIGLPAAIFTSFLDSHGGE